MNRITSFLNPEQAMRACYVCWRANEKSKGMGLDFKFPVALIGDTGCGKTTAAKDFHAKIDKGTGKVKLYTVILSMDEPTDIGGVLVPNMKEKRADHLMLGTLPFDCEDVCVILADEYDRSTPEVQNTFSQVLLPSGSLHGHKISPNSFVILTMNGTADIYTTQLSKAARTRVVTLFMSSQASGCEASHEAWARQKGLPDIVSRFWSANKDKMSPVDTYEEMAELVPRTLDMAGLLLDTIKEIKKTSKTKVDDILFPLLAGTIGIAAARELLAMDMLSDFRVEDIFRAPMTAPLMDEPSRDAMILELLVSYCKNSKNGQGLDAVAKYTSRIKSDEMSMVWWRRLGQEFPTIAATPEYVRWANKGNRG